MTSEAPIVITVSHNFRVSAETVFDAWLNPVSAARWLFATPSGTMVTTEIDPRAGGKFLMTDRRDGQDVAHHGTYLKIERPRLLEFDFAVNGSDFSRVRVSIEPTPVGCEVQLVHTMDARWSEWTERTRDGWTKILASLDAVLVS